jgi:hypothetical protein
MKRSDVTAENLLPLLLLAKPQLMTEDQRDDYLVGDGPAYLGFHQELGFIVDADGSVAVFDTDDEEGEFTWFRISLLNG